MKIIKAHYEILDPEQVTPEFIYGKIERAGRTCYKSEDRITEGSAERFVRALAKSGHEAMLEHASFSVRFTVDRGISHEIVRHRIASFAQESQRYCSYDKDKFGNEITVIEPCFFADINEDVKASIRSNIEGTPHRLTVLTGRLAQYHSWYYSCRTAEECYFDMLKYGATPQEARSALPNSTKTEIVVTASVREWRHILKLRAAGTTGAPHPQMLEVMVPLLEDLQTRLPALFMDIKLPEEG